MFDKARRAILGSFAGLMAFGGVVGTQPIEAVAAVSPPPLHSFPTFRLDRIMATTAWTDPSGVARPAPGDIEGMAYDPVRNTVWLADDSKGYLYEVDYPTGAFRGQIELGELAASTELIPPLPPDLPATAGEIRSRDIEGIAYDSLNDVLYVVAGPCCPAEPHLPTIFRLARVGGAFAPETFQPLNDPLLRDFSGLGVTNGQLWMSAGQTLYLYDYATNSFLAEIELPIRNNINGLGFSEDGTDLWMTTSDEVLRRYAWPLLTLHPNHTVALETVGLLDSRAVEVVNGKLLLADGFDDYELTDPLRFGVHEFSVRNDAPGAGFTIAPATSGGAPFEVTLNDTSIDRPNRLEWDFGDGTMLVEAIPTDERAIPADKSVLDPTPAFTHLYQNPGNYTIRLTASNPNGSTTVSRQVSVTAIPAAAFTATPMSGVAPLTVSVTDTTVELLPITSRSWNFGDGSPTRSGVALRSAQHTFDTPGVYTVTLAVANAVGPATATKQIVVNGPPSAGFTSDVSTGSAPLDVSFSNFSSGFPRPNRFKWEFGDGAVSEEENPAHLYAYPGTYQVRLTATNAVSSTTSVRTIVVKGSFAGYGPIRMMDTRRAPTVDGLYSGEGQIGAGQQRALAVIGRGGVPATGVGSVALNITATGASDGTYLTVWPQGKARPYASNLNVIPGRTSANMVIVPVGSNGNVMIFNESGGVDVIVDLLGWFPSGPVFTGLSPARLLDTRNSATVDGRFKGEGPIAAGSFKIVDVLGRGGVPRVGVGSVALNVTVTNPTASSYLTVWPKGFTRPNASNLNWNAGDTVPNMVIVPIPDDGQLALYNELGTVDVIVDVLGWFPKGPVFTGLPPARLLDSRPESRTIDGTFRSGGPVGPNSTIALKVLGRDGSGIPASGVGAVALNVTATNPTAESYLTVFAPGGQRPTASNLNFSPGRTVPNLVIVPVGPTGEVLLYNHSGSVDLIVDVLGWFPTAV